MTTLNPAQELAIEHATTILYWVAGWIPGVCTSRTIPRPTPSSPPSTAPRSAVLGGEEGWDVSDDEEVMATAKIITTGESTAKAGDHGTATAGDHGTATAGDSSTLRDLCTLTWIGDAATLCDVVDKIVDDAKAKSIPLAQTLDRITLHAELRTSTST